MQMSNDELLRRYDTELIPKIRNKRNLRYDRRLLGRFRNYIGDLPPSSSLVKSFIAQYADRAPATQARYASTLKAFMKWYGQPMDDFHIKVPKTLPQYVEDTEIDRLIRAIEEKRSHKKSIVKDRLMVELYLKTGMRRGELANLEAKEIHEDFLMVRKGKGQKDRMIPLLPKLAMRLNNFIKGKHPDEKVFGLTSASIGNKIRTFARKAGLIDIHTHSLRHKYATDLLERGVNIRIIQELLGHEDISTTQGYLSVTDQSLHDAVGVLGQKRKPPRGIRAEWSEILESAAEVTVTPARWDPWESMIAQNTGVFFTIELESDDILIESLQVRSSDPEVPYQLLLFETEPRQLSGELSSEDLIQMSPVKQRIYTYPAGGPIPYKNRDKMRKIYGGLGIGQRALLVDLLAEETRQEQRAYLQRPVDFSINLRYRTRLK